MVQQAMERKQPLRAHSCHMPMQVDPTRLPPALVPLAHTLATLPGAVALVLGGSQADRGAIASSDWDLVVYYRGTIDWRALAPYGEVHPPGSWGRLMNGGAWLQVGHLHVDVILRDLDVAMHWTTQASVGAYELDALLGYLAGLPTYSLAAELASGHVLAGEVPQVGSMPMALRETAPLRWRFRATSVTGMRACTPIVTMWSVRWGRLARPPWKRPMRVCASVVSGRSMKSVC